MDTPSKLVTPLALMQEIAAGDAKPLTILLKAGEDLPLESLHAPELLSVEIDPKLASIIAWGIETLIGTPAILSLELGLESAFNWLGLSLENGFEGIYAGQTAIRIERDQILFIATGGGYSECGWSSKECLIETLLTETATDQVYVGRRARRYLEEDSFTMDEIVEIATQAQPAT